MNLLQNFNNGLINSKKEISKMGNKQLKNMLIRNTSGIFEEIRTGGNVFDLYWG